VGKMTSTSSKSALPKPSRKNFHPVQKSNSEALEDFSGEGFNPRDKKLTILFAVCWQRFTVSFSDVLYFFPVFLKQETVRSKQLDQANLENLNFFTQVKTHCLRSRACLAFWLQTGLLWYGKHPYKYSTLSKERVMNLHAPALALRHLHC